MASQFSSRGSSAATATGRARGARDELNDPRPPSRDASVQATSGQSKGVSIEASYYEGTDVGCQASTESIGGVHGLATLAMPLDDGDELMRSIHAASSTRHAMGDSGSNMRRWGGSNKAPSAEAMTGTAGVRLPPGGTFRRGNAIGRGALPPRRSMESGKQASRQATPSSLAAAQEMSVETLVEALLERLREEEAGTEDSESPPPTLEPPHLQAVTQAVADAVRASYRAIIHGHEPSSPPSSAGQHHQRAAEASRPTTALMVSRGVQADHNDIRSSRKGPTLLGMGAGDAGPSLTATEVGVALSHQALSKLDAPSARVGLMDSGLGVSAGVPSELAEERIRRIQDLGLSPRGTEPSAWLAQALGHKSGAEGGGYDESAGILPELSAGNAALLAQLNKRPHRFKAHAVWKTAAGWTPRYAALRSHDPHLPNHPSTMLAAVPVDFKQAIDSINRIRRSDLGRPEPLDGKAKPRGPLSLTLEPRPPKKDAIRAGGICEGRSGSQPAPLALARPLLWRAPCFDCLPLAAAC